MKVTPITEKTIQQANCDWIKAQAEELKALFDMTIRQLHLIKRELFLQSIQQ